MNNTLLTLCGIFYSILCIFSIITGIIYMSGKKKLNPIELSNKFIKKLDTKEKRKKFTIKMGFITFIVGLIQGLTAYSILKKCLYLIPLLFTIFSILSVLFKLKSKFNYFSLIKLVFYLLILIILIVNYTVFY